MLELETTDFMPSQEKAAEVLRSHRWKNGLYCPHCQSDKIVKNGVRKDHIQQYACRACGKCFNDRTKTIFDETRMHLNECLYAIKAHEDGKSTNRIKKELERHW
ncbi:MAG: transposase, partial [Candidatus Nanohaloarchaea archaeon]|nr:transposase [Candidatus Nanohaloarchaea archaeon]